MKYSDENKNENKHNWTRRFLIPWTMGLVLLISSCMLQIRGTPNDSHLNTNETLAVMRRECKTLIPENTLQEDVDAFCRCVNEKKNRTTSNDTKNSCATQTMEHLTRFKEVLMKEGELSFRDTPDSKLNDADAKCLEQLARFYLETTASWMSDHCRALDDANITSLTPFLSPPQNPSHTSCWRMTHMDQNACIIASPCVDSRSADLEDLPLSTASKNRLRSIHKESQVREGEQISLCNKNVQNIFNLKDPSAALRSYNYAFANMLTIGRSFIPGKYEASNCHGVAQAVVGGFLDSTPIQGMTFNGPSVEEKCKLRATEAFHAAENQASKHGDASAQAKDFPIQRGGHTINMDQNASCKQTQCGNTSLFVYDCDAQGIKATALHEGMCRSCWSKKLEDAGLNRLSSEMTWKDLKPGCVLTTTDHSVSTMMINDNLCYYFESTSAFGPALLRVEQCPILFSRFEDRYCPKNVFEFEVHSNL